MLHFAVVPGPFVIPTTTTPSSTGTSSMIPTGLYDSFLMHGWLSLTVTFFLLVLFKGLHPLHAPPLLLVRPILTTHVQVLIDILLCIMHVVCVIVTVNCSLCYRYC